MAGSQESVKSNKKLLYTVIVVILVVALAGVAWYFTKSKDGGEASRIINSSPEQKKVLSDCEKTLKDKDFCLFMSSYSMASLEKDVTMTMEGSDAPGVKTVVAYDNKGNNKMIVEGNGENYQLVNFEGTSYMWDSTDNSWNALGQSSTDDLIGSSDLMGSLNFDEKEDLSKYVGKFNNLGTEACGTLTCHKYSFVDTEDEESEEYIVWFDTKDFKIRKLGSGDQSSSKFSMTFDYSKVNIEKPSPVKSGV